MSALSPARRWVLFALVLTAGILNLVDRQIIAVLKPVISADLHWNDNDYGTLAAWFQGSAAFAFLVTGWLADRLGVKWANPLGVVAWSMAAIAHAWAFTIGQFTLVRMALGASEAMGTPTGIKTIATIFPPHLRSTAFGLSNAIGSIGAILAPLAIPVLAVLYGWRSAFVIAGLLGMVWAVAWLAATRGLTFAAAPDTRTVPPGEEDAAPDYGPIVRDRRTWAIALAKVLSDATWWLMLFWMPDFFNRQFGLSGTALGPPLAVAYTGAAVGSVIAGSLATRLLLRGGALDRVRKGTMLVSALAVLPIPLALHAGQVWSATLILALALGGHQGFSTTLFALISDVTPRDKVGRVTAFGAFCGNLGGMTIAKVAGLVLSAGLGYLPLFLFASVSYLLALGWIELLLPRIPPRRTERRRMMSEDKRGVLLAAAGPGEPHAAFTLPAEPKFETRGGGLTLPKTGARPRNIVVILTDDHRYDAMGFMGTQDFIETPMLDRLAREGAHFRNAFVTTALCSPSRATIFTGLYAHQHRVVDNNHAIAPGLVFFPEYLQAAGYETAFIGKWHMGLEGDDPQPGFDRWVSFKGQGDYWPNGDGLNGDGERIEQDGYLTDVLNDFAMDWLESRTREKPFMLFLAHKAVHAEFYPAPRHEGRFAGGAFRYPETMAADAPGRPMWVENQRNSWHGVDFAYHARLDVGEYYKRYMETFLAVDEGIGRIVAHLEERGELDETLILYMGDNGFMFGEHGLIDKRTAYEESMRIPMLARCPALFAGGTQVDQVVANLDIAPWLLGVAGLEPPGWMEGSDLAPLLRGEDAPWRDWLLYEYYWERNFPQTPTVHAIREDRYKYVHFHGIWDIDELYDLQEDPLESRNLIFSPGHEAIAERLNAKLFDALEATGGLQIPLPRDAGERNILRDALGPRAASFPEQLLKMLAR